MGYELAWCPSDVNTILVNDCTSDVEWLGSCAANPACMEAVAYAARAVATCQEAPAPVVDPTYSLQALGITPQGTAAGVFQAPHLPGEQVTGAILVFNQFADGPQLYPFTSVDEAPWSYANSLNVGVDLGGETPLQIGMPARAVDALMQVPDPADGDNFTALYPVEIFGIESHTPYGDISADGLNHRVFQDILALTQAGQ